MCRNKQPRANDRAKGAAARPKYRESRQTTTTAESGGAAGLYLYSPRRMVKTPRPPFIGTNPPKRGHEGAYHRNERGETWTRERGQSLNAARRMVGAGRVFCPPRVQYSPPARKPETDGRRAFSFGRVLDVFGQRAKEYSRAAETTRRVFQTRKHETPRVVSVVETHAGGFRYGRNRRRPPRKGDDRKPTKR